MSLDEIDHQWGEEKEEKSALTLNPGNTHLWTQCCGLSGESLGRVGRGELDKKSDGGEWLE